VTERRVSGDFAAHRRKGAGELGNPQPASSLPGPQDILRRQLPNGITILARENWTAPSVVLEGYLTVGNLDEPAELMGLASYTSSMLSRGTLRRSFGEINETVESVGAALGFGADRYNTSFSTKSLTEDLDLVLSVLSEEMREPAFPAEHVERLRGMRLTALAERENNTRQMAGKTFRELLYADHPLSYTLLGTRETNNRIRRDQLVEFYQTYYKPQGMVIVVVGALPAEEAADKVAQAFGDWTGVRPPRRDLPPISTPTQVVQRHVAMTDKSQSDILLGWPAMRRRDPDFEAARLANSVLGVFGMMGRLGANVRERQGMAYYSYSQLSADRLPGIWALVAGVNPANVDRAVAAMLEEVERLLQEPVPADELEDSKRHMTGSVPLQLETNDGVAGILVDLEWQELGLDYIQRYSEVIAGLTAEQVQAAAQKYLHPDAYALAVAGP
jgi:zinc protease